FDGGFFTPARRDLVRFAERQLEQFLQDNLTDITPDPNNPDPSLRTTVTYTFPNPFAPTNPQTRRAESSIANPTIPANVIRVYLLGVRAADLTPPGSQEANLAQCGPADSSYTNTPAFRATVLGRGQPGALASPATDTSVAVVYMWVNQDATYYENTALPAGG